MEVHLIISDNGKKIIQDEIGKTADNIIDELKDNYSNLTTHDINNMASSIASGFFKINGMIIMPCSMATLAEIAMGISKNLLGRSAEVCLKERRKLIIVPRETPLNNIHLRNMLYLSEAGAEILPAMPGFYHKPETINDMVDFIVGKVLENLNIRNNLLKNFSEDQ
ncbi:putative aromatic acid decarboxylase [Clostridium magnum DSM 2767]|uniref:Putative aromatic acid decarboxylase n=2 Tax=Clostridium magnum TaxID=33954 RepID=A0A161WRQ1_9CLOT|nr:putative aromatic acid decarboxylase [Clostridium magnum DSM 2767]SHI20415.1 4-hydroxy-3-polyprenylbenzoate decarboxylase [Clostridium magnum DSM 2767]